jgi:hypothetical protein
MPRKNNTADETVTVRLPAGMASRIRAATGQPFSTVVRWMCVQLLERKTSEINQKEEQRESVQSTVASALDGAAD